MLAPVHKDILILLRGAVICLEKVLVGFARQTAGSAVETSIKLCLFLDNLCVCCLTC